MARDVKKSSPCAEKHKGERINVLTKRFVKNHILFDDLLTAKVAAQAFSIKITLSRLVNIKCGFVYLFQCKAKWSHMVE